MTVTVLQYGILITLGYYFGSSYAAIATHLKSAGIIVALAALVVVFVGYRKFTKKIAESLIEETI
ncbi:MAG: hypothetical protein JWN50_482 [Parcubacteria group bacterium]|nr:hypothetical protein [Parcubacteria group bacterium]